MSWFGSSARKTTIFYVVLIAMASLVVGMVIASRLDLSPTSSAQTLAIPSTNTAPLSGAELVAGTAIVCADDVDDRSSREAMTMPTTSDAMTMRTT